MLFRCIETETAGKEVGEVPRVLVVVNGGIADYLSDQGVDVAVFDWDNYKDDPEGTGGVPSRFAELARSCGVPVDGATSSGLAPAETASSALSGLDDQLLIDELQRRGRLVSVWSLNDFEFIGDTDPSADALSDQELAQVQSDAFAQCHRALDDILTARGNDFLGDWWEQNRDTVLPHVASTRRDTRAPSM